LKYSDINLKSNTAKGNHSTTVKKSITIYTKPEKAWKKISKITDLSDWLVNIKKTIYISKIKTGIGAIREIHFEDGNIVEEHIVGWKKAKYFSYIAVSGLPLRCYHATISIQQQNPKSVRITWQTYLNSEKMTSKEFKEFVIFLETFYEASLKNLKKLLEK